MRKEQNYEIHKVIIFFLNASENSSRPLIDMLDLFLRQCFFVEEASYLFIYVKRKEITWDSLYVLILSFVENSNFALSF